MLSFAQTVAQGSANFCWGNVDSHRQTRLLAEEMKKHCLSCPVLQSFSAVFPDLSKLYNFLHVHNSIQKDGLGRTRLHQGQWGQHNSPGQLTTAAWSDFVSWTCSTSLHCPYPPSESAKPNWAEEGAPPFTLCVESFVGDQWWFQPALTLPYRLQRNKERESREDMH